MLRSTGRPAPVLGRPFHVLVVSNAVSSYGTYLNLVALNLYVLQASGSALSLGLFLLLRTASAFLSGYAAGRLVVRCDRMRLMIGADLGQALTLLAFLAASGATQTVLLYALAAVMGGCSTLSGVARRHSVPDFVGQQSRVRANGLLVTGRSLAMILGFASAGLVVALAGYTAAFLVDAASFLVSALALTALVLSGTAPGGRARGAGAGARGGDASGPEGREARSGNEEDRPAAGGPTPLRGRSGLVDLWRFAPVVVCLVLVRAVDNMGSAAHQVGLPVYAAQVAPGDAAAFVGRFFACWAVGCLLAHQLVSRVPAVSRWAAGSDEHGRPGGERAFAVGTCLMSAFFVLVFAGLPAVALVCVAVAAGIADGFTEIVYHSRLQALPEVQRGRLLGMAAMAETGALGVGTLLWASLLDHMAPFGVVATAHGSAIALALLFLLLRTRLPPPTDPADAAGTADGRVGADEPGGDDRSGGSDRSDGSNAAPTAGEPAGRRTDSPSQERDRWTPTT